MNEKKFPLQKITIVRLLAGAGSAGIIFSILVDPLRGKPLFDLGPLQWLAIGLSGLVLLAAFFMHSSRAYALLKVNLRRLSVILFVLGGILLAINFVGLFVSTRNPVVYTGVEYEGIHRKSLYTPEMILSQINKEDGETNQEYASRLNQLIYDGVIHYWEPELADELNLRVPVYENFILWGQGLLNPDDYYIYEFMDSEYAIERGVGICSQSSKILVDILGDNGIKATSYVLSGHVIVHARVDNPTNTWWVLDADYGVVIEENVKRIEKDTSIAQVAYREAGYSSDVAERIAEIYGPVGNFPTKNEDAVTREALYYQLKWIIPIALMLPFGGYLFGAKSFEEDQEMIV
ncbi:MAG: hypothetical protein OEV06_02865 [Anaerolineae bacterium]|nr:hypothetical protein [Anaerolineae bacterium]